MFVTDTGVWERDEGGEGRKKGCEGCLFAGPGNASRDGLGGRVSRLDGTGTSVAAGVDGRDGFKGEAIRGRREGPPLEDGGMAGSEVDGPTSSEPKNESKLSIVLCPLCTALPGAPVGLTEGTLGGAGGGGGSMGGRGPGSTRLTNDFMVKSWSSSGSSFALGTMSERNSRSSDDSARELRGFPLPNALRRREKRLRKRETADGAVAGGTWVGST